MPKGAIHTYHTQFIGTLDIPTHTIHYRSPKFHMHQPEIMPTALPTLLVIPYYVLGAHVFKDITHDTQTVHYVGRRPRCRYIIGHKIW